MQHLKRLTALVMAAVMVLSLAGCGGSGLAAADFELRYDPVLWAVENGITFGMTSTTFAPNQTCTRGQVVTFLYRAFGQ